VARIGITLVAVLAAALLADGSNAAYPGIPSIYVTYTDDCTFSMSADGGFTFTSSSPPGATIPPGLYQILVLMGNPPQGYTCTTPVFTLTGPGVNSVTAFPQQATLDNHVLPALQPSSTYMAYDTNAPNATRVYFTTAATGSSSSLLTATPTQTTGKGASQPDLVGSGAATPTKGTIVATIDSIGLATLRLGGKTIHTLKAGYYAIRAVDPTRRMGLMLDETSPLRKPRTLTTLLYKGTKTVVVDLTAGQWRVYTNPVISPATTAPDPGPTSFKVVG
jgi:hypothetical protein